MKYLVVGLGNIGREYEDTRHNIGFNVLDAFVKASNTFFEEKRYGAVSEVKIKGRTVILLKPNTYMNLSGKAVKYWLDKEKIPMENLLVIVDDLALPFGAVRLRAKGSPGGHNGLKNIDLLLSSSSYARLRYGIGDEYKKGQQIDYVLGRWDDEEYEKLPSLLEKGADVISSFVFQGVTRTMNVHNTK